MGPLIHKYQLPMRRVDFLKRDATTGRRHDEELMLHVAIPSILIIDIPPHLIFPYYTDPIVSHSLKSDNQSTQVAVSGIAIGGGDRERQKCKQQLNPFPPYI